ncbi:MAG: class F sortase [Candidatus Saccharimonas sp.]
MGLSLFALTNATIFSLANATQHIPAQTITTPGNIHEETQATDTTPVATTIPTSVVTPSPVPAPAPTPARAPAPTPVYDKVSIPSIGLSSQYVTVGTTATNAIDVNPTLVGWWNGSAQPGTFGAVFLDGHNPGVFRKLPSIQVGALITLTKASGEVFNYTVAHTEVVQLAGMNMGAALSTYGGASEGLNLMTCVGTYSAATGTTDQRLIVYAVRS